MFFFTIIAASAEPVFGNSPHIHLSGIEVRNEYLVISAELQNWITRELRETFYSTIPIEIRLSIRLYRHKSFWFDDRCFSKTFSKKISFDRKTRQFTLEYEDGMNSSKKKTFFTDFDDMLEHINSFIVFISLSELSFYPKRKTYIRIRASMSERYELYKIPGSFTTTWTKSGYFILFDLIRQSQRQ